ncbi:hypothetical protein DXG01_003343 [Tephrocybe rancida]|nr:hypothetical protein DXG01_003343 [Tephrocybe rancida]
MRRVSSTSDLMLQATLKDTIDGMPNDLSNVQVGLNQLHTPLGRKIRFGGPRFPVFRYPSAIWEEVVEADQDEEDWVEYSDMEDLDLASEVEDGVVISKEISIGEGRETSFRQKAKELDEKDTGPLRQEVIEHLAEISDDQSAMHVMDVYAGEDLPTSEIKFRTILLNSLSTSEEVIKQAVQRFRFLAKDDEELYYLTLKQTDGGRFALLRQGESIFMALEQLKSDIGSSSGSLNDFMNNSGTKLYLNRWKGTSLLRSILNTPRSYQRLLRCPDPDARDILELCQLLLDSFDLPNDLRRQIITASQRLSAKANDFPSWFFIHDPVSLLNEHAISSGSFGDIYKATLNGEVLCLKVLRANQTILQNLSKANVLVDRSGRAYLADFGLSNIDDPQIVHWTSQSSVASKGGSVRWQAPELHEVEANDSDDEEPNLIHNTEMSDVFAWGCLCYEILDGHIPLRPKIGDPAWLKNELTESVWNLMEECWSTDPLKRPVIHDIIARLNVEKPTVDTRPLPQWPAGSAMRFRTSKVVGFNRSLKDLDAILLRVAVEALHMFHGYYNIAEENTRDGYAPLDDTTSPDDVPLPLLNLPSLPRHFFNVPPLTDKPQNPIMDTLKQEKERIASSIFQLPPELGTFAIDLPTELSPRNEYNLWTHALTSNFGIRNKALSWDRLRPSHPSKASSTGFLSEQDDLVFAAARYHVNLRLRDPAIDMIYVTQTNILNALKTTVLGTSSVYHTWDPVAERFVPAGLEDTKTGFILIDGKDEVVSKSLMSRFVTIGTLLRRLETLLAALRKRSAHEGPTVHAYAHALATIVIFLRQSLARGPPVNDPFAAGDTLSAIWMHYEIYEETFVALANLYGRDEAKGPDDYPAFDPSPVALLSSIYQHLDRHIERQSPRTIIAIFAFILTHVSHEYLQQVSRSVGYGTESVEKASRIAGEVLYQPTLGDEEEEEHVDDLFDSLERLGASFPDFFPRNLLDILPAAQKSLVLLERAQPDHPMLRRTVTQGVIQWFWTKALVEAAWNGHYPSEAADGGNELPPAEALNPDRELSIFRLFDLEPGASAAACTTPSTVVKAQITTQYLQSFIDAFPSSLPSITPTLPHLTSLVLAPLVDHASALSTALLTLFLTPSTTAQNTLNFEAHLTLLQSYLLLTAPPFKARISAALFSDREAGESDNKAHGLTIRSLRQKMNNKKALDGESSPEQPWAVGLAPSLLERKTWPPVGADLSFFLRTVIVDSIEDGGSKFVDGNGEKVKSSVLEEAEYRLGFAIRDLPTGHGKDKALDFLYMDYKPPTALEVLITPSILLKYQRMSAFILRLMRVEHALASLFRMTRTTAQTLFPTLTTSRKALLHFRFVAQSFVSNISAYVFDTAISGNFDPFLTRLSLHNNDQDHREAKTSFSDVFALANEHSALLDDMLSACLLRSGQRAVGEVLRSALELILEFTIVVGQLHRGRMEEYEAAPLLEDISKKFFGRMAILIKVLKGLADKNGLSETTTLLRSSLHGVETPRRPTGGADALYHLLIRLELGDWWTISRQ